MSMNDLLPFQHGEEGTHSACLTIIERDGKKALCCECNGHNCEETPMEPSLEEIVAHLRKIREELKEIEEHIALFAKHIEDRKPSE